VGAASDVPGAVFCLGRTYAAHAAEMGAPEPDDDLVVFLKPPQAVVRPPGPVVPPPGAGEIHHEAEVVVRVGAGARAAEVGLGLDLTDRTRQARDKAKGLPWASAKGWKTSAALGPLLPVGRVPPLDAVRFVLRVNGAVRQRGDTRLLLWPVPRALEALDRRFGLREGDLVFTGTPEGVGPVVPGDVLDLEMEGVPEAAARFVVGPPER
jgi:2-keto-4-pentenoate hydratase/2-oxohepta-3-ene-1,7-dioic acid hydratase in catechol pathway